jgi:hypothetical protein
MSELAGAEQHVRETRVQPECSHGASMRSDASLRIQGVELVKELARLRECRRRGEIQPPQ